MPCDFPLQAVRLQDLHPTTGKRRVKVLGSIAKCYNDLLDTKIFAPEQAARLLSFWQAREGFYLRDIHPDDLFPVPCGKCAGCRLERSRQWAVRCVHEASLYEERNSFITLTFNDRFLPRDNSLDKKYFQDFMKRLRKCYVPTVPKHYSQADREAFMRDHGIRYYHCGEYGELFQRPHYHALLFNHVFDDLVHYKNTRNGCKLYTSEKLQRLWSCPDSGRPYGFVTVGEVTFDSAAYCARYIMKKVFGDDAESHYCGRLPEYTTMSRAPGIAKGWFDQFWKDIYPKDKFHLENSKGKMIAHRPPRYYDSQFELIDDVEMDMIKIIRLERAKDPVVVSDNIPERRVVKAKNRLLKIKDWTRTVDSSH